MSYPRLRLFQTVDRRRILRQVWTDRGRNCVYRRDDTGDGARRSVNLRKEIIDKVLDLDCNSSDSRTKKNALESLSSPSETNYSSRSDLYLFLKSLKSDELLDLYALVEYGRELSTYGGIEKLHREIVGGLSDRRDLLDGDEYLRKIKREREEDSKSLYVYSDFAAYLVEKPISLYLKFVPAYYLW